MTRDELRDQLLKSAQRELELHTFATFEEKVLGAPTGVVVVPGCPNCRKRLHTISQFMRHLSEDILPGIVDEAIGLREPGLE
jgi:hypothetical protein